MTRLPVLAAALAAAVFLTSGAAGCQPSAGPPADCRSPSPYSLYDRPGHGIRGLVQIICDTQPQTYDVHITLEYRYKLLSPWLIRAHQLEYYTAPDGPLTGHLYEYRVGARCQPGWWRMVVFAEGVSSDSVPQTLLRWVPRYRGMRVRHCR